MDRFNPKVTLEGIRKTVERFVSDRDWHKYHTPRNVALALVGEVGEVCELIQWKGELAVGAPELSDEEKVKLGEELSDVLVYLLRLAGESWLVTDTLGSLFKV